MNIRDMFPRRDEIVWSVVWCYAGVLVCGLFVVIMGLIGNATV